MTLGFDGEFFMRAAGAMEFVPSFALVCTPLVRRIAAILLAAAFVCAIVEFGKIDAIGHAPIIVAMVAIAAADVAVPQHLRTLVMMPTGYATTLACFIGRTTTPMPSCTARWLSKHYSIATNASLDPGDASPGSYDGGLSAPRRAP